MKNLLTRLARQSPAMIVAMLALFAALSGTAVATTSALITGTQIKNSSITGLDVKNKSLTPRDFRGSVRGPRGLRGPAGPTGATGATGPPGAPNPNAANSELLDGLDSTQFQKVPTVAQHFTIPGSAIIDSDGAGRNSAYNATADQFCTAVGAGGDFFASINLAQGVTITALSVDYIDDAGSVSSNGTVYITKMPLRGQAGTYQDIFSTPLANVAGAGTGTDTTPSSAAGAVVDNAKHVYNIIGFATGSPLICGINITYTVPAGFSSAAIEPVPSQPVGTGSRQAQ